MFKIGDIIKKQIEENNGNPDDYRLKMAVASKWNECVGYEISRKTSIKMIKDGIVFVAVANSVWASHLTSMKKDIVEKLNSMILPHKINDIRFQPSYKFKKEEPFQGVSAKYVITEEDRAMIKEKASAIEDSKDRAFFERIMEKDLAWKKENPSKD